MTEGFTRRSLFTALAWLTIQPAYAIPPIDACDRPANVGGDGMWQDACKHGIQFGSAVTSGELDGGVYTDLVTRECAVVTPSWEMKWGAVQKQPGVWDFTAADRIATFARHQGLGMRGHCLVWHNEMPDWLPAALDGKSWQALLAHHIAAVVGHYRMAVSSWDVVNEAVEPDDGRPDGLRNSPWLRAAGPAYIADAFKMAGHLAPGARLVYNDYGLEQEAPWTRKRRSAVLKLLEQVKKSGAPIHALGLQSHLHLGEPFAAASLAGFLREVQAMNIQPIVTELDVSESAGRDIEAAALARSYLDTVLAANCDTVVVWGLSDDKYWRAAKAPDDRPLPFDRQFHRKPLYDAIQAAIAGASI